MPLEEISVYMSHEDTDTRKGYIYYYMEIEKNCTYMDKALLEFKYVNGCKCQYKSVQKVEYKNVQFSA